VDTKLQHYSALYRWVYRTVTNYPIDRINGALTKPHFFALEATIQIAEMVVVFNVMMKAWLKV
jgi:hypothetical protein